MKKVLFVDEKFYRFAFYYNDIQWWRKKNIDAHFKAYETKKVKWLVYIWLIINRPKYAVFVQLSIKNIVLVKLCNILNVKTLFWQHGVFGYDDKIIEKYRRLGAKLNILLCFSQYDRFNISRYFKTVGKGKIIPHYEIEKISNALEVKDGFLFIGQILTQLQITDSKSRIKYDAESEKLITSCWEFMDQSDFKLYVKKHPGDCSRYFETITKKYKNIELIEDIIVPKAVVGHYSTLILPYIAIGIPFIQIRHINNDLVDFTNYGETHIFKINEVTEIESVLNKVNQVKVELTDRQNYSISNELVQILNDSNG
jgi:hypothetical protein